eukprot:4564264-Karenia_brevis.AAC.1
MDAEKDAVKTHLKKGRFIGVVKAKEVGQRMRLDFQVAYVAKPLLAAKRIVERGSHVVFGPGKEDKFIIN